MLNIGWDERLHERERESETEKSNVAKRLEKGDEVSMEFYIREMGFLHATSSSCV